jgi:methionine-rich copper-binding protein CopC
MTRTWRAIAAMIMAAAAVISVGAPATAHAELESSSPGDGAELDAAPSVISFTFGEELIAAGNAITLTDIGTGSRLDLAEVEVDSNTASVTWPDTAGSGQYRAAYRVVSADGHPIAGSITFTIAGPGAQSSASPQSPDPTGVTESPTGHTADPTTPATSSAREENWVLGALGVLLLGAGLLTWFIRRRRV